MEEDNNYKNLLTEHSAYITKEQFYKICHVSKRTAQFLLESGLVPSTNTGKKTRKYKIAMKDVVIYLIMRERNPQQYSAPVGLYKGSNGYVKKSEFVLHRLRTRDKERLIRWLTDYPDVLSVPEVTKITGYSKCAVVKWCNKKKLHHFLIMRKLHIPKQSLVSFMLSDKFSGIKVRWKDYKAFKSAFKEERKT